MNADLEPRGLDLGLPGVKVDRLSLRIVGTLPYEDWEVIGLHLGLLRDLSAWLIGDWLNFGEASYGERAAQGADTTGRSPTTVMEFGRVARAFPPDRRRPSLSFTHHQVVAARPSGEREELLDQAAANRWNVPEFRGMLQRDPALLARRAEVVERVEDAARALLEAVERDGEGFARVPESLIDRLAAALGARQ